ncbi:MAG: DNA polymerase III subunit delta [Patescibacteria group bacterium]
MIIFIYGPDTFRSREKLKEVIEEFKKKRDPQGYNVVRLEGKGLTFERFRSEARTAGFLSPRRMVVVENLLQEGNSSVVERIKSFLEEENFRARDANVVVFWEGDMNARRNTCSVHKRSERGKKEEPRAQIADISLFDFLASREYVFSFPLLEPREVSAWIRERVRASGSSCERAVAEALAAVVGSDLWRADREIGKLAALRRGAAITKEDLMVLVETEESPSQFALTDAAGERNVVHALPLYYSLVLSGIEPLAIHSMLVRLFHTIALVKSYMEETQGERSADIGKVLGIHPYVAQKTIPFTRQYSWEDLQKIYRSLLAVDMRIKTESGDATLPLELFIADLRRRKKIT